MAKPPSAAVQAYRDRETGQAPNGEVGLRDFDLGMVRTLGGELHTVGPDEIPGYYANVSGVAPAPGLPGVQIVFGNPDDAFVNYLLPMIVVTRDDVTPAMSRWMPGSLKYRAPKPGTPAIQVTGPGGVVKTGYRQMVQQETATPYDIAYTLTVAHDRRGLDAHKTGHRLLKHVMRRAQPYFYLWVVDSLGDDRIYFGTAEAATTADELVDVADRLISWTMSVTVEAHLDFLDEDELRTATAIIANYSPTP